MKKFLNRYLPDHQRMRENKYLRLFGERLHEPGLWHLNRRTAAGAVGLGLFIAFVPVPIHTWMAIFGAIWLRVNLPLTVLTIFITNPVTIPPFFYFSYKVGAWLLSAPPNEFSVEFSLDWLLNEAGDIWAPLLVGSLAVGVLLGTAGYAAVRSLWRLAVLRKRRRLVNDRLNQQRELVSPL